VPLVLQGQGQLQQADRGLPLHQHLLPPQQRLLLL
jgi:hypothetical protein